MATIRNFKLPLGVFLLSFALLAVVQVVMREQPILIAERFWSGAGWIQIAVIAFYGTLLAYKMQDPQKAPRWRRLSWTLFTVVFFGQLALGLLGAEQFLMSGKLHLPIPMMILGGPVYRMQLSFMSFLFLSTLVLTGPAWCSHLCYFGALDQLASDAAASNNKATTRNIKSKAASNNKTGAASNNKTSADCDEKVWTAPAKPAQRTKRARFFALVYKKQVRWSIVLLVIVSALALRWLNVPVLYATLGAVAFGLAGLAVMLFLSRKYSKMIHCSLYCPIGTLVSLGKKINPFRMTISPDCTLCMKCSLVCPYYALNLEDIKNKKPGSGCTYCGDCLSVCDAQAIHYRFFGLSPKHARQLYLLLTISMHCLFLALAKI